MVKQGDSRLNKARLELDRQKVTGRIDLDDLFSSEDLVMG